MREEVLKRFFLGQIDGAELARDIRGSQKRLGPRHSVIHIDDMKEQLTVTRQMLIKLCDAVISGGLYPDALAIIGFALQASDHFEWDRDKDELIADVIADWSSPEINYPLTIENIHRFRKWLDGSEQYPRGPDAPPKEATEIVSIIEKRKTKRFHWLRSI
jgi:hypothetical protein